MTAPVPDCDDDHAELSQRGLITAGREGLGHRFGLRARVDIGDDRVGLLGIEVEWLVNNSIKIGDSIGGLDGVGLRELVACFFEL